MKVTIITNFYLGRFEIKIKILIANNIKKQVLNKP